MNLITFYIAMKAENLKRLIENGHINFLIGSGLSLPYLSTLNNIEYLMMRAAEIENVDVREIVEASIFNKYFKSVMEPCLPTRYESNRENYNSVLENYKELLNNLVIIVAKRFGNQLDKQINIFTTNIDLFIETAAENLKLEYNNGFKGQISPVFNEDSFNNIVHKTSSLYQYEAVVPNLNVVKIHGAINWKRKQENSEDVVGDMNLSLISALSEIVNDENFKERIIDIDEVATNVGKRLNACPEFLAEPIPESPAEANAKQKALIFEEISNEAKKKLGEHNSKQDESNSDILKDFLKKDSQLVMINPRKTKFKESVLDVHFYELMRLFSNVLEKTSSLLFVAGFSFADEHIRKIVQRAADANPTLNIIVFAYDNGAKSNIIDILGEGINQNILVLSPEDYESNIKGELQKFDLASINKYVFHEIVGLLNGNV